MNTIANCIQANMTFTIFEVSQLLKSGTIHAVIQGAVVLCLQQWELGCLPESLCWLQAPSLSMFPVIMSVNDDRLLICHCREHTRVTLGLVSCAESSVSQPGDICPAMAPLSHCCLPC